MAEQLTAQALERSTFLIIMALTVLFVGAGFVVISM